MFIKTIQTKSEVNQEECFHQPWPTVPLLYPLRYQPSRFAWASRPVNLSWSTTAKVNVGRNLLSTQVLLKSVLQFLWIPSDKPINQPTNQKTGMHEDINSLAKVKKKPTTHSTSYQMIPTLCDCVHIPLYLPQAPEGQSSRSRTWIRTSWWWWGRWCPSVCRMLEGKERDWGKSRTTPSWMFRLNSKPITPILLPVQTPEGWCSWWPAFCCYSSPFPLSQDVLCRRRLLFRSHMLMPVFTLCEKCVRKWEGDGK